MLIWGRAVAGASYFKGQYHNDFPGFLFVFLVEKFTKFLFSTLFMYELLLDRQRDNIKECFKEEQATVSFYPFYLRHREKT